MALRHLAVLTGLIGMCAALGAPPASSNLDARAAYHMALRYHQPLSGGVRDYQRALMLYCRAVALGYEGGGGMALPSRGKDSGARCPDGWSLGVTATRIPHGPAEIRALVEKMAPNFDLDPKLVMAVIGVESSWQVEAVSSADARGLMQLIPATAERFGVLDVFDPADNLRGGMTYLRWLLNRFDGDVTLALAAYNAGEGAVARHGGIPPYKETQGYVRKVRKLYPAVSHP
jgi:soluble lytic murein transglycosylase-like protein